MQVWMLEILDSNYYGAPDLEKDLETHPTLKSAKDSFWRTCDGERLGNEMEHQAYIFFYDPREVADPYPDRILTYGPRGGIRVERC